MKFTKLYKLFLVISPLSFFSSIFFSIFISKSDVMSWRAFSVLMPICVISLVLGLVLLIIDKSLKKATNDNKIDTTKSESKQYSLGNIAIWLLAAVILFVIFIMAMNLNQ